MGIVMFGAVKFKAQFRRTWLQLEVVGFSRRGTLTQRWLGFGQWAQVGAKPQTLCLKSWDFARKPKIVIVVIFFF